MSTANKCDRCGKLYEPTPRTLILGEVCVLTADRKTLDSWTDVDFCPECSAEVLKVIGPALEGLDEPKP